jgi:hypothetical protein
MLIGLIVTGMDIEGFKQILFQRPLNVIELGYVTVRFVAIIFTRSSLFVDTEVTTTLGARIAQSV